MGSLPSKQECPHIRLETADSDSDSDSDGDSVASLETPVRQDRGQESVSPSPGSRRPTCTTSGGSPVPEGAMEDEELARRLQEAEGTSDELMQHLSSFRMGGGVNVSSADGQQRQRQEEEDFELARRLQEEERERQPQVRLPPPPRFGKFMLSPSLPCVWTWHSAEWYSFFFYSTLCVCCCLQ